MAACASLAPPIGHRVLGGAMFLLVIGLVAVIIAILVAAFLSMRRGSDDEDGPVERLSMRDRVRSRGRDRDARWEDADAPPPARRAGAREPVPSRRPGRAPREYTADDVADRVGFDSMPGYEPSSRGYGGRTAGRGSDRARGDRARRATTTPPRPSRSPPPQRSGRRPLRPAAGPPLTSTPGRAPRCMTRDPPRPVSRPRLSTPTPTWRTLTSSPASGRTSRRPAAQQAAPAQ